MLEKCTARDTILKLSSHFALFLCCSVLIFKLESLKLTLSRNHVSYFLFKTPQNFDLLECFRDWFNSLNKMIFFVEFLSTNNIISVFVMAKLIFSYICASFSSQLFCFGHQTRFISAYCEYYWNQNYCAIIWVIHSHRILWLISRCGRDDSCNGCIFSF